MCLPPGSTPLGASCVWPAACATGDCSPPVTSGFQSHASVCGRCTERVSCAPPCAADQQCLSGDGGTRCVHVPVAGEECDHFCHNALCSIGPNATRGICVPLASLGEACGVGPDDPRCAGADSYCDATGHCQSSTLAVYGAPCGYLDGGAYAQCTGYGRCDSLESGMCVPPAPDGALCDPEQGLICLTPAACISHHCLYPSIRYCSSGVP
jgi:hypothetical protein